MGLTNTYPSLGRAPVFVTGGASGIGEAIVRAFAAQGAKVAFVDIDEARGEALAAELAATGGPPPLFMACDIRDTEALRGSIEQARARHGDLAVLVNNAANDTRPALAKLTPDDWDDRLAINLRPMVFAAQAVAGQMARRGGGAIVNFGSISWKTGMAGMVAYTTAKAAVHGLTRSRVTTVTPGWGMTERQLALWVDAAGEAEIDARQCITDRLAPADIAAMVLFLASDDARLCTSQDFTVDGGWS